MAAFEEADPNNTAKRIVDHIINTKSRPDDFIKQTEDFLPDQDQPAKMRMKNGFLIEMILNLLVSKVSLY